MRRKKILMVVGTRPEAIKLGPVARSLAEREWAEPAVVTTGQHGAVVDEALALFGVRAADRLATGGGELNVLTASLVTALSAYLTRTEPDLVVVQGDTTSAFAGAYAAHMLRIPVAHVEAGLRSHAAEPFPEEANRRMIAQLADLHLCPTPAARDNLAAEHLPSGRILVTGNTVIDALHQMAGPRTPARPLIVVTAHRRESWGEPMRRIGRAVALLARTMPHMTLAVAAHMNPAVRETLTAQLDGLPNVEVGGPRPYDEFVRLMAGARLVVTDSGGVQEEATALGVPALVLRDTTERVEGLRLGLATLVGTDVDLIVKEAVRLVGAPRPAAACPYGDGHASARVAQACAWLFGLADRPDDFVPADPLG